MERLVILLVLLSIADCYSVGTRWPTNNLTWRLINFQNTSTIFEKAFKTWSDVANLTFTQIHSEGSNISIEFVPFDINAGSLAKAYPPEHIKKGMIRIDRNENWNFRTEKGCEESKYSLLSVAIHEIGHALGLGESSDKDAVMYFRYRPLRDFSSDDIYAIQQLYGAKRANR